MQEISSLQHPLVKYWVKLRTNRDFRYENQSVLISGIKLIKELSTHFTFRSLITQKGFTPSFSFKTEEQYIVTDSILKKVTGLNTPEPIAAELPMIRESSLASCRSLLILDGIADPGNLGTLFRTALALNWEGIFLTQGTTDPYNEKALRAAKGATFYIPWCYGSLEELSQFLSRHPFELFAADAKGIPIQTSRTKSPIALILGNEAHGIAASLKTSSQLIAIPMNKQMESLNVATAGAILMYILKERDE